MMMRGRGQKTKQFDNIIYGYPNKRALCYALLYDAATVQFPRMFKALNFPNPEATAASHFCFT